MEEMRPRSSPKYKQIYLFFETDLRKGAGYCRDTINSESPHESAKSSCARKMHTMMMMMMMKSINVLESL